MSRLLCCLRARRHDMGAALSHHQEGECDGTAEPVAPPTMADVIRERKKKAGGAALGTLRRRLVAAARRPRDARPDRGCEHARFIRSVVSSWRLAEVFVLCEQLEAGAALRDLLVQAELAREPAPALHADLLAALRDRWWCDVELVGAGWSLAAHRAILAARCSYFRELLQRYPSGCRVPLEGVGASLSKEELQASVRALYAGPAARRAACDLCSKWERNAKVESDLDIISGENTASRRSCACGRTRSDARSLRRLGEILGFSIDTLHRDMKYLLESGEQSDARLVFRLEGGGAAYGFRTALELPCHRLVLAARSRFFRSVLSRGACGASGVGGGAGGGAVCVDERVLPRRFARALLHAAYTDQVDLGLIGRNSSSPSSTNSTSSSGSAWRSSPRASASALDDAFQLYEIARFVEMPIVVQGCEDAIVEALSAETLPHVLRWAAAPHASRWVHRQAMRYLRDEFPAVMSQAASARLPRSALASALGSDFLQASEAQALRALLRWAERAKQPDHQREPNVVWHASHSGGRRAALSRRRAGAACDSALREALAALLPLVRLEHLPPDCDLLHQAVRRGLVPQPPPQMLERGAAADAWLARGSARPPRCFLPYLDEIKALLEDQAVPEAELARVRRARYLHRIPDTLYMVAAAQNGSSGSSSVGAGGAGGGGGARGGEAGCVSPRTLGALRARVRELRASPPAVRALELHATDTSQVHEQIALRAVREMSLPDSCADLLLADCEENSEKEGGGEEEWEGWGEAGAAQALGAPQLPDLPRLPDLPHLSHLPHLPDLPHMPDIDLDCCRSGSGSLRSITNSRAPAVFLQAERDTTAARPRELPPRLQAHRSVRGRLSACVPDVAMAPNANTHLLTARDFLYQHQQLQHQHQPADYGGAVLQLDLGDGATHTPRPGSRAQRAAAQNSRHRDSSQAMSCVRSRTEDDELRAAIELSVIKAYSSLAGGGGGARRHYADLLPADFGGMRSRATPSPSALSAASVGNVGVGNMGNVGTLGVASVGVGLGSGGGAAARRRMERLTPPPRLSLSQAGSSGAGSMSGSGASQRSGSRSASPSPTPNPTRNPTPNLVPTPSLTPSPSPRRPRTDYSLYRHHDYRAGGSGAGGSRSPANT